MPAEHTGRQGLPQQALRSTKAPEAPFFSYIGRQLFRKHILSHSFRRDMRVMETAQKRTVRAVLFSTEGLCKKGGRVCYNFMKYDRLYAYAPVSL